MEEVPIAETDPKIVDTESQESIDRVPESPPLFTQDNDSQDDDIEAQLSGNNAAILQNDENKATIFTYDNENNTARSSREHGRTARTSSDVIIDMGASDDNEIVEQGNGSDVEFPEEDNALLVSAAEIADESTEEPGVEGLELTQELQYSKASDLNEQLITEDKERKKIVNGFRKFKANDKIFPDVRCSEYNTVAFNVTSNYTPGDPLEPNPAKCMYKWEPKFVPMPYCNENIIVVRTRPSLPTESKLENVNKNENTEPSSAEDKGGKIRTIRIWQRIKESLTNEQILCSQDFVSVFKRYCRVNPEFKALDYCVERIMMPAERIYFFDKVVPFMVSLILHTSEIVTCPIPFLRKNLNHNISLTQKQVACLLSNAFFSTFPRRFKTQIDIPSINFKDLFTEEDERVIPVKAHKIRCLINYFTRIESQMPQGVVTYTRKNLRHSNMPEWSKLDKCMTKLVPVLQGTIEDDGDGMLRVDFANSNIGGGALGRGAVQEEILFVIYPELMLTRLFTEKLNYNEAVIVTGCERFSTYQGYSLNFKFGGDYQDVTAYDSKGRRCTQIVAIDALYISRPTFQYHPKHILRELNKAYVGFSSPISTPVAVASGKWGCGAFNGDPQLKTIIQLLAASHAGRDIVLFTFEDVPCLNDILSIYNSIGHMKIKDIWNLLNQYHSLCCSGGKVSRSLKDFCQQYADGQSWVKAQDDAKQPTAPRKTKEVPITHFYSYEKRQAVPPDDATVAAITNGIDKINSLNKSHFPPGKRQREDEVDGLCEYEIQQQLLSEHNTEENSIDPVPTDETGVSTPSPKSSKRPKRLPDFFPGEETG